jgi:hypothetical protein
MKQISALQAIVALPHDRMRDFRSHRYLGRAGPRRAADGVWAAWRGSFAAVTEVEPFAVTANYDNDGT